MNTRICAFALIAILSDVFGGTMTAPVSHPLAPFLQPARRFIRRSLLALPEGVREFVLFGLKMAWSCLFGAGMLAGDD